MADSVTRGSGKMEGWLAAQRCKRANRLIHPAHRAGTVLDIGCGSYPFFLLNTDFTHRIGLDRDVARHGDKPNLADLRLIDHDFNAADRLPLEDKSVEVVTMLAVFEHIPVAPLEKLLDEIARLLKPGGQFVMTTPAAWTGPVLWAMTRLGLVSAEEIDEHEDSYSVRKIKRIIARTSMRDYPSRFGLFEFCMNIWGTITKPGASNGLR